MGDEENNKKKCNQTHTWHNKHLYAPQEHCAIHIAVTTTTAAAAVVASGKQILITTMPLFFIRWKVIMPQFNHYLVYLVALYALYGRNSCIPGIEDFNWSLVWFTYDLHALLLLLLLLMLPPLSSSFLLVTQWCTFRSIRCHSMHYFFILYNVNFLLVFVFGLFVLLKTFSFVCVVVAVRSCSFLSSFHSFIREML